MTMKYIAVSVISACFLFFAQSASASDYTYTNQEQDKSGLLHYDSRYYDPDLGRFLQPDSYDVPNKYAYVSNDPVNRIDPSGHTDEFGPGNRAGAIEFIQNTWYGIISISAFQSATSQFNLGLSDLDINISSLFNKAKHPVAAIPNYPDDWRDIFLSHFFNLNPPPLNSGQFLKIQYFDADDKDRYGIHFAMSYNQKKDVIKGWTGDVYRDLFERRANYDEFYSSVVNQAYRYISQNKDGFLSFLPGPLRKELYYGVTGSNPYGKEVFDGLVNLDSLYQEIQRFPQFPITQYSESKGLSKFYVESRLSRYFSERSSLEYLSKSVNGIDFSSVLEYTLKTYPPVESLMK